MAGRFGKYGDAKRKSQIRKARHARPYEVQKMKRGKALKSSKLTKRRGF